MKTKILLVIASFVLIFSVGHSQNKEQVATEKAKQLIGKGTGLMFIENKGQIKNSDGKSCPDILYYVTTKTMNLYFTNSGISYVLVNQPDLKQV